MTTIDTTKTGAIANNVNLRPLDDRIIVKQLNPETVTKGGILLPDKAQKPVCRGTVVAVGPGKRTENGVYIPVQVHVGDVVAFAWAGAEITEGGEKYLVLREAEVLAVIESNAAPTPQYAGE